ncbi:hypothetical protein BD779DRAFT_1146886 [Infundibulicybe gibba]|nr:hypothetical protein BD779DRAFT_1146886 [Infundibulicybe gibba]
MPFTQGYDELNRFRALLAKSFAISRKANQRNLEFHWYGVWNIHLCILINAVPNAFVVPQFPLWIDDNDDQDFIIEKEDSEDGDEPEEEVGDGEALPGQLAGGSAAPDALPQQTDFEDEDELDYNFADLSFTSSHHAENPRTRIPDFAIIWAMGAPTTSLPARYTGWRIIGVGVPVIVEIKRSPPRSLTGEDLAKMMKKKMGEAQFQLADQATHLFRRYPKAKSVIAIAAVGPYWCNKTIYPSDTVNRTITGWSAQLKMYSAHSDRRFQTVLKEIKKCGDMSELVFE